MLDRNDDQRHIQSTMNHRANDVLQSAVAAPSSYLIPQQQLVQQRRSPFPWIVISWSKNPPNQLFPWTPPISLPSHEFPQVFARPNAPVQAGRQTPMQQALQSPAPGVTWDTGDRNAAIQQVSIPQNWTLYSR